MECSSFLHRGLTLWRFRGGWFVLILVALDVRFGVVGVCLVGSALCGVGII